MGFRRRSLTRRQNLQGVGTRCLALLAAVRACSRAHVQKTTTTNSWMGLNGGGTKKQFCRSALVACIRASGSLGRTCGRRTIGVGR